MNSRRQASLAAGASNFSARVARWQSRPEFLWLDAGDTLVLTRPFGSRPLNIKYRTSEQIRQWAQGLLEGVEVDDLDGGLADTTGDRSIFRGPDPQMVSCGSVAESGQAVVAWVKGLLDAGLGTHEICVTPTTSEVVSALESAGIPTLELKPRQKDPGQQEPGVRYGTKKRIKGLEFKAVALLHEGAESADSYDRFANYVAVTRAREHLLVVGSPSPA